MNIFNIFKKKEITEEEIDAEVKVIRKEQEYRRKYVTPPPIQMWSKPIIDNKGYVKGLGKIQTNQSEIDRWKKKHFDWCPDKV